MRRGAEGAGWRRVVEAMRLPDDPLLRLDAIRRSRERLEALEVEAVRDARQAGVTWKALGALYGLSKQGAQQRFRSAAAGAADTGEAAAAPPVGDG